MFKVTFKGNEIFQNGVAVGRFEGSRTEVYVTLRGRFVARYKYSAPKAGAKHFMKWALGRFSPEEILAKQGEHGGTAWAGCFGYQCLNTLTVMKEMAMRGLAA